ncbi:hypothetical protein O4H53_16660 [Sulfitobacter sp. G21635-S1]|uniref:hypothetical protein n=1 Tax=Sulfitobacter sp. G21635-S1 TaxID=3014043 RepID=UPI0022AFBF50|nr:hypothetical protein [Sulfitobacter sp. G21635-S1]MCZ4257182.1 hypothetical protein [Sulfitobacter sp. G21635-S1]
MPAVDAALRGCHELFLSCPADDVAVFGSAVSGARQRSGIHFAFIVHLVYKAGIDLADGMCQFLIDQMDEKDAEKS